MPKVVPEYKEEAKRRIMKHATKLFSERGYSKTRMIDIAKSMGVSKGAIYQYFRSKQDLLMSVLQTHTDTRGREVRKVLDSENITAISTGEFFDRMLALRMGSLALGLDLLSEAATNRSVLQWIRGSYELWVEGLSGMIDGFITSGVIRRSVDSESLARGILALRDGLYSALDLGSDKSKARRAWVTVMSSLMKEVLVESKTP
ncbi:MAG: TetR/AcrR family transcriptional regulator [Candidatus Thorarchaeota archaeon]